METRRGSGARHSFSLPAVLLAQTPWGSSRGNAYVVPVPATQGSAPVSHSSLKRRKARGASRRIETWGFPSPAARRLRPPPHPRPKCQVSSRGGGWLRGLPSRAVQAAKSPLPSDGQDRAHTFIHTLTHIHTLTRPQTHTLRRASEAAAEIAAGRAHFPSFPTGGARGAGRGQWRN